MVNQRIIRIAHRHWIRDLKKKKPWDWLTAVILPGFGFVILPLFGLILVSLQIQESRKNVLEELDHSRSQLKRTLNQQALQGYLNSMSILIAEKLVVDPEQSTSSANTAATVAARGLTTTVLKQLSLSEDWDSSLNSREPSKLFFSLSKVQPQNNPTQCASEENLCIPEKRAVIDLLVEAQLVNANIPPNFFRAQIDSEQSHAPDLEVDVFDNQAEEITALLVSQSPQQNAIPAPKISLEGVNLDYTDLSSVDLSATNLRRAHLRHSYLRAIQLDLADLGLALMQGANLEGAKLRQATLSYADMTGTNLRYASMVGANLEGSSLAGASLEGTNLKDANLEETNLEGATYTTDESGCPIEEVDLCQTVFPVGFKPESRGMILWSPN